MKPPTFASNKTRLAAALGIGRSLLYQFCRLPDFPLPRANGMWHIPTVREYIAKKRASEEAETFCFRVPTSFEANAEIVADFRELLRVSLRCGWLPPSEVLEIIMEKVIGTISDDPPHEAEAFDELTRAIHEGFGVACWLLDDDATDKYLRRSAAALERARKKLFQSDSGQRACK